MRDAGHASCRSEALRSGLETTLSAGRRAGWSARPRKQSALTQARAALSFPLIASLEEALRPRTLLFARETSWLSAQCSSAAPERLLPAAALHSRRAREQEPARPRRRWLRRPGGLPRSGARRGGADGRSGARKREGRWAARRRRCWRS